MYEKSLILIKPDGLQRRLVGRLLQRFEDAGLTIHALKLVQPTDELVARHYAEHVNKPFFPSLQAYFRVGPVVALVLGGTGAVSRIRKLVGATAPSEAEPGTIRGDFAHMGLSKDGPCFNLIHASATPEEAAQEITVWFDARELLDYPLVDDRLLGVSR